MNRNEAITGLVDYALEKELIRSEEKNMGSEQPAGRFKIRVFPVGRADGTGRTHRIIKCIVRRCI